MCLAEFWLLLVQVSSVPNCFGIGCKAACQTAFSYIGSSGCQYEHKGKTANAQKSAFEQYACIHDSSSWATKWKDVKSLLVFSWLSCFGFVCLVAAVDGWLLCYREISPDREIERRRESEKGRHHQFMMYVLCQEREPVHQASYHLPAVKLYA